ncbi:MAG: SDR family oxidoreductase [Candidatus Bathyarchaeota archaeon]|nr:SDR family oxidoreductase [Candidatus Bathyarchaeota archaeon]
MGKLNGKVAVVTGAAQGIGREIALVLAEEGAAVFVLDISDKIFEVAKEAEGVIAVKCDVTDPASVESAMTQAIEKHGSIDILVNNAGIYPQKPFLEMTKQDWDKVININLNGTFNCTKAVIPKMVTKHYGKIVNIASIAGAVVGFSNLTHYSASKGAVAGFTKSLALEMAPHGINVNAIAPGPIDVGIIPVGSEIAQQTVKAIPVGRMGQPRDIADLVVFLASNQAGFITGQCIVCDGGYTLP